MSNAKKQTKLHIHAQVAHACTRAHVSGLKKHEEILQKRERQMLKIDKERSEITMRLHAAEQVSHVHMHVLPCTLL
jgi:hypothetical protein